MRIKSNSSKMRTDQPKLEIYSDYLGKLLIIDQEHEVLATISSKGRIRTYPLPQQVKGFN